MLVRPKSYELSSQKALHRLYTLALATILGQNAEIRQKLTNFPMGQPKFDELSVRPSAAPLAATPFCGEHVFTG